MVVGEFCQFDVWQPRAEVPGGHGQTRRAWVVVACLGYSRDGAGALIVGIAALAVTGTREAVPSGAAIAAGVPLVVLGHLTGRRGFRRLARDPARYELALTAVLVLTAIGGLLTVLR